MFLIYQTFTLEIIKVNIKVRVLGTPRLQVNYNALCEPSQKPGLLVCLQTHMYAVFDSSATNILGVNSVPLWLPSQNGCLEEFPHEHHAYFLPASNSTAIGAFPAIFGVLIDLVFDFQ